MAYQEINAQELWIAGGTSKTFRLISVLEIVKTLVPKKALSMPILYAFTGCDQTSSFAQRKITGLENLDGI